jgi:hypothetical protein
MPVTLRKISTGVEKTIKGMLDRSKLLDGYLNRVVLPDYIRTQRARFESHNDGNDFQGGTWPALNQKYAEYKRKKYGSYPGGGEKTNIRTSRLISSLTMQPNKYDEPDTKNKRKKTGRRLPGTGSEFAAIVNNGRLSIYTLVPYAQYVDEKRTFSMWSPSFYARQARGAMSYLIGRAL